MENATAERQKLIACEVMKAELLATKTKIPTEIKFLEYGLHSRPELLHKELQKELCSSVGFTRIILAYGLCGGAAKGLVSPSPLVIPRIHDCIPLLLGSRAAFKDTQAEPGTYYMSCGWLTDARKMVSEYERVSSRYGRKKADRVYSKMFSGYTRELFIHTSDDTRAEEVGEARKMSEWLSLRFEETRGTPDYFIRLLNGPWAEEDFIIVPAGAPIDDSDFQ